MTTSVSLTLNDVWISDGLNPSVAYVIQALSLQDITKVNGTVRTYAGGRQRAVSLQGTGKEVDLTVSLQDAATVTWLQGKLGSLLLLRDPFGLKVYGVMFELPRLQQVFSAYSDYTVKFLMVTNSEAV
jgi:hypothetical protein